MRKKIATLLLAFAFILSSSLFFAACDNEDDGTDPKVTGIAIELVDTTYTLIDNTITVVYGEQVVLDATDFRLTATLDNGEEKVLPLKTETQDGYTFSSNIPSSGITPAGDYKISFGYKDLTETKDIAVKVEKATVEGLSDIRWNYTNKFTYDGTEKEVKIDETTLPQGVSVRYEEETMATNAGTYSAIAIFTYSDTTNYNAIPNKTLTWEIEKADISTSGVELQNYTYNGSVQTATLKNNLPNGFDCTITGDKTATNAGTYNVTLAISATGENANNYNTATLPLTWSIAKKALTIKANDKTIAFGENASNNGVTYDGIVGSDNESVLVGTLSYDYGTYTVGSSAGSYTITPSGLSGNNYEITYVNGTLTVETKTIDCSTLTWAGETEYTFSGNKVEPKLQGVPTGVKATYTYTLKSSNEPISGGAINVGNYTASVTLESKDTTSLTLTNANITSLDFEIKVLDIDVASILWNIEKEHVYTGDPYKPTIGTNPYSSHIGFTYYYIAKSFWEENKSIDILPQFGDSNPTLICEYVAVAVMSFNCDKSNYNIKNGSEAYTLEYLASDFAIVSPVSSVSYSYLPLVNDNGIQDETLTGSTLQLTNSILTGFGVQVRTGYSVECSFDPTDLTSFFDNSVIIYTVYDGDGNEIPYVSGAVFVSYAFNDTESGQNDVMFLRDIFVTNESTFSMELPFPTSGNNITISSTVGGSTSLSLSDGINSTTYTLAISYNDVIYTYSKNITILKTISVSECVDEDLSNGVQMTFPSPNGGETMTCDVSLDSNTIYLGGINSYDASNIMTLKDKLDSITFPVITGYKVANKELVANNGKVFLKLTIVSDTTSEESSRAISGDGVTLYLLLEIEGSYDSDCGLIINNQRLGDSETELEYELYNYPSIELSNRYASAVLEGSNEMYIEFQDDYISLCEHISSSGVYTLTVTATDGTTKTYTITIVDNSGSSTAPSNPGEDPSDPTEEFTILTVTYGEKMFSINNNGAGNFVLQSINDQGDIALNAYLGAVEGDTPETISVGIEIYEGFEVTSVRDALNGEEGTLVTISDITTLTVVTMPTNDFPCAVFQFDSPMGNFSVCLYLADETFPVTIGVGEDSYSFKCNPFSYSFGDLEMDMNTYSFIIETASTDLDKITITLEQVYDDYSYMVLTRDAYWAYVNIVEVNHMYSSTFVDQLLTAGTSAFRATSEDNLTMEIPLSFVDGVASFYIAVEGFVGYLPSNYSSDMTFVRMCVTDDKEKVGIDDWEVNTLSPLDDLSEEIFSVSIDGTEALSANISGESEVFVIQSSLKYSDLKASGTIDNLEYITLNSVSYSGKGFAGTYMWNSITKKLDFNDLTVAKKIIVTNGYGYDYAIQFTIYASKTENTTVHYSIILLFEDSQIVDNSGEQGSSSDDDFMPEVGVEYDLFSVTIGENVLDMKFSRESEEAESPTYIGDFTIEKNEEEESGAFVAYIGETSETETYTIDQIKLGEYALMFFGGVEMYDIFDTSANPTQTGFDSDNIATSVTLTIGEYKGHKCVGFSLDDSSFVILILENKSSESSTEEV